MSKVKKCLIVAMTLVCSGLFSVSVLAVDGVLEINQTCIVNSGCFAGDTPGFPVSIIESGSYRLTSNLEVDDETTTAIQVTGDLVYIDLNGFTISGPTRCTGSPAGGTFECSPTGAGTGIDANGQTLTVINGSINGMGSLGVRASERSRIENLHIRHTGSTAIDVSFGSVLRGNRISNCGGGIVATSGVIAQNHLRAIGSRGIVAGGVIVENEVANTDGDGMFVSAGVVRNNDVAFATGLALSGGADVGYTGNIFRANNGGNANPQVSNNPQEMGTNICGGDPICP